MPQCFNMYVIAKSVYRAKCRKKFLLRVIDRGHSEGEKRIVTIRVLDKCIKSACFKRYCRMHTIIL